MNTLYIVMVSGLDSAKVCEGGRKNDTNIYRILSDDKDLNLVIYALKAYNVSIRVEKWELSSVCDGKIEYMRRMSYAWV